MTYLQYDSPFVFGMQVPPCLHGEGEHDMNPETKQKINQFRFNKIDIKKIYIPICNTINIMQYYYNVLLLIFNIYAAFHNRTNFWLYIITYI